MSAEPSFTAEDALKATAALRAELGIGRERLAARTFVGMISDEIAQLREAGRSDNEIAALVARATGKPVEGTLISRYFAGGAGERD